MAFGAFAFSETPLGSTSTIVEATASVTALATSSATALQIHISGVTTVLGSAILTSTASAVTTTSSNTTGTSTSTSSAVALANVDATATGLSVNTSTAVAVTPIEATSTGTSNVSDVVTGSLANASPLYIVVASTTSASSKIVANEDGVTLISSSTVSTVSANKIANPVVESAGNAILNNITVLHINVAPTEDINGNATLNGTGLRNVFFNPANLDYRRLIHIPQDSNRYLSVPPSSPRILYINRDLPRIVKVA